MSSLLKATVSAASIAVVGALAYKAYLGHKEHLKKAANKAKQHSPNNENKLLQEGITIFRKKFHVAPTHVGEAPGRVNIIGEHTDYSDGFVFPMAIERVTYVIGKPNAIQKFRLWSYNDQEGKVVEFTLEEMIALPKDKSWHNYFRGVVAQYIKAGHQIPFFDAVIIGNVPLGGGLSSSASLEVATASFLDALLNTVTDGALKAIWCQKAEHEYAGVPCGIMDQFISSCGKKDTAMLLDCRKHTARFVKFTDPNVTLLITNSNVKHELSGGEYAARRRSCEEAVKILSQKFPHIKALRDATMEELTSSDKELDETTYKCARHVISECNRTLAAADFLEKGAYKQVGTLMNESHWSLQNDFKVSCKELDILTEIARKCPGVYGSRMTGGGFGGCTVTLLESSHVSEVMRLVRAEYVQRTQIEPSFIVSHPGKGAVSFTL